MLLIGAMERKDSNGGFKKSFVDYTIYHFEENMITFQKEKKAFYLIIMKKHESILSPLLHIAHMTDQPDGNIVMC